MGDLITCRSSARPASAGAVRGPHRRARSRHGTEAAAVAARPAGEAITISGTMAERSTGRNCARLFQADAETIALVLEFLETVLAHEFEDVLQLPQVHSGTAGSARRFVWVSSILPFIALEFLGRAGQNFHPALADCHVVFDADSPDCLRCIRPVRWLPRCRPRAVRRPAPAADSRAPRGPRPCPVLCVKAFARP